eukprot:TRINITY_DN78939_c0_g1_i1.p1 TRINITY_DN78939_c0_g1~~TRINITY_DN78939_c0_g1_i1.p1  ORF type:complete len:114 (-),score=20.56 TRINITY_DN78939_c0_g1_i1:100-402(-)
MRPWDALLCGRAALAVLCWCVHVVDAKPQAFTKSGQSVLDVESPVELVWRLLKVCLAFSPILAIVYCVCCVRDDPEEEEKRRNSNGGDFTISKKGGMKQN